MRVEACVCVSMCADAGVGGRPHALCHMLDDGIVMSTGISVDAGTIGFQFDYR